MLTNEVEKSIFKVRDINKLQYLGFLELKI